MTKKYLVLAAVLVTLGVGMAVYSLTRNDEAEAPVLSGTGIKGTVFLGPTCSVQSIDNAEGSACDNRPYQTELVVTTSDQSKIIKQFSSDQHGTFSVVVPSGEYVIRSAAITNIRPYCSSGTIKVAQGNVTSTTVTCDTGIR